VNNPIAQKLLGIKIPSFCGFFKLHFFHKLQWLFSHCHFGDLTSTPKLQNTSGTHADTWWWNLAADLS
jgi:hypothetical protein